MELNITKFNEAKLEFSNAINKYGTLDKEIENKTDFEIVSSGRKELKILRVNFQKFAKEMRDEANKFSKSVIEQEKEGLAIIEPVEDALQKREDKWKEKQEMEKRKLILPLRIERLGEINISMKEEDLLKMDDKTFDEFFISQKQIFLEEKERKIKEEQDKLEAEKARIEAEEKVKKQIEKAQKEAEEKVKKDKNETERRYKEEIEKIKQAQIQKELQEKAQKEAEEKAELEEKQRLEKETRYKDFLKQNEGQFDKIIKEDGKIVLYKKIAEFII